MAKQTHDREDLLRDARNMPIRGQMEIDDVTVLIGFRAAGQASLYCGDDPVFQFNAQHELRRVFYSGQRFVSSHSKLHVLDPDRSQSRLSFRRVQVTDDTASEIIQCCHHWLQKIRPVFEQRSICTVANSHDNQFIESLANWYPRVCKEIVLARTPSA